MESARNELLESLLDSLGTGVIAWRLTDPSDDRSLRLAYANKTASVLTARDLTAAIGKELLEIFPGAPHVREIAATCRDGVSRDLGAFQYDDGRGPAITYSVRVFVAGDAIAGITFQNLTLQARAEADARHLNRFLDSVIEHVPAMIFVKNAETLCFERFNRAGEELLGRPRAEFLGKTDHDFFPKEQADFFVAKDREVLAHKHRHDIVEEPLDTPSGVRWLLTRKVPILDDRGEATHLLGISLDITAEREARERLERRIDEGAALLAHEVDERKEAQRALRGKEEQLRQAQKMEAIGQLAGGIAHDFNNLLSVILSYCDMTLADLSPSDPLRQDITEIRSAGASAAALTHQLLAFSRQQVLEPRILDLNQVVHGTQGMLRRILGEDVNLQCALAPKLGLVNVDPGQVQQVILNLAVNARDAMPTGGRLTIETADVMLSESYAAEHLGTVPGPHVMLAVTDNGAGMDAAIQARIFEPFFTTKPTGKGTGLGLSTVFGIVQQSGGSIWVYSEPGFGTTFKVYLPMARSVDAAQAQVVVPAPRAGNDETILLVEDEDRVRAVTTRILRGAGYRVLAASRGADALALATAPEQVIALLLTDVVMPEMSGRVLAEKLGALRPGVRVLFMSGYTDDTIVRHGVLDAGIAFLQKPVTPDRLLHKVRDVLDAVMPPPRAP